MAWRCLAGGTVARSPPAWPSPTRAPPLWNPPSGTLPHNLQPCPRLASCWPTLLSHTQGLLPWPDPRMGIDGAVRAAHAPRLNPLPHPWCRSHLAVHHPCWGPTSSVADLTACWMHGAVVEVWGKPGAKHVAGGALSPHPPASPGSDPVHIGPMHIQSCRPAEQQPLQCCTAGVVSDLPTSSTDKPRQTMWEALDSARPKTPRCYLQLPCWPAQDGW